MSFIPNKTQILSPFCTSFIFNLTLRFWEDAWCGGVVFKSEFHRLYAHSLLKDGKFCDFYL